MNPTTEQSWWSSVWDSGVFALAVLGPERRYRALNEACCRLFESDASTLEGWGYERVGHVLDLDTELDAFVRLAAGARAVTYVRRFRTARDREFTATVHAIAGAEECVLQMIVPSAVASSAPSGNAAQMLEQIAAVLSHDALEPVRQLGVSAGMLIQRLEPLLALHERERALLLGMEQHAQRLGRQLRALVRYARLGAPVIDSAPHPLRAVIDIACAKVEFTATITLHDAIAPGLMLRCDPVQLATAVEELLRNAIAPHVAGRPTTVTLSAELVADRCLISVRDDGVGIAAIDQPRLFRLFAASGPGAGAGVGLALVRAVAVGHGGEVRLESTQGVGTLVQMFLPR